MDILRSLALFASTFATALPAAAETASPIAAWIAAQAGTDPGTPPYQLSATLGGASAVAPALAFRLTNTGATPLRIDPTRLPWANTDTIQVLVLGRDGHAYPNYSLVEPLPPVAMIELAPGASLHGEFELNWQVELPAQRSHDAIVLWSYAGIAAPGARRVPVATGALVLPAGWKPR